MPSGSSVEGMTDAEDSDRICGPLVRLRHGLAAAGRLMDEKRGHPLVMVDHEGQVMVMVPGSTDFVEGKRRTASE